MEIHPILQVYAELARVRKAKDDQGKAYEHACAEVIQATQIRSEAEEQLETARKSLDNADLRLDVSRAEIAELEKEIQKAQQEEAGLERRIKALNMAKKKSRERVRARQEAKLQMEKALEFD